MAVDNKGWDFTIVAGADLSAHQYKAVNLSGVLATSATNGFGILQGKTGLGEHASVRVQGVSKAMFAAGHAVGAFVGYSGTSSGWLAAVTSGGIACGRVMVTAASGYLGTVYLFGGPTYIAL